MLPPLGHGKKIKCREETYSVQPSLKLGPNLLYAMPRARSDYVLRLER